MTPTQAAAAAQKRIAESINRSVGQHHRAVAAIFARAVRQIWGAE